MAVVFNADASDEAGSAESDRPPSLVADAEVVEVASAVADALGRCGWSVALVPLVDDLEELPARLAEVGAASVFNLVESLGKSTAREPELPALLERLGVPYTGSPPWGLRVALAKDIARNLLAAHGLPVPRGRVVRDLADFDATTFSGLLPAFVKPARSDASIGIDQGSVVYDAAALSARVRRLLGTLGGPILVEEYLPGPELNVALLPGASGLIPSVTRLDFSSCGPGLLPIVTYDGKWNPESREFASRSVAAAPAVDAATIRLCEVLATAAFLTVGGVGYGRVDLRLDRRGRPRVIDVNTNCCLHPESGFSMAASLVGFGYDAVIDGIARSAALKECHALSSHRLRRSRTARVAPVAY